MAIYLCEVCDEMKDGDWDMCVVHPNNPEAYCCEQCADDINEKNDLEKLRSELQREVESGLKR